MEVAESLCRDYKKLLAVGISNISSILSDPSLEIRTEDFVYEFVRDLCRLDAQCFCLFEHVLFEHLSVEMITDFISMSSDFPEFHELMNCEIWFRLCNRLILPVSPLTKSSRLAGRMVRSRVFEFKSNAPLSGIISSLTSECGGNVHDRGVVAITDSSHCADGYSGKFAADLGSSSSFFHSLEIPRQWLCYDFKDSLVSPTHYSIRTYQCGQNANHLKSWILEISNDDSNWKEIDRRENNVDLNGDRFVGTYSISGQRSEGRFVRLRQIGKNHMNKDYLTVSGFELFGTLYP
jgi:hypothetical protein